MTLTQGSRMTKGGSLCPMIDDRAGLRLAKLAERDRRISLLYTEHPELKELQEQLTTAGIEAVSMTISGLDAGSAKQKVRSLQIQRGKQLEALGLDETVFEAQWDCDICQDRGYVSPGQPCVCAMRDDGRRKQAQSGLSALQKRQTFDAFSLDWYDDPKAVSTLVGRIKAFVDALITGQPCGNLFLYGPIGNGKTHLCSAAANRALEGGLSVAYYRTGELLEALREELYGRADLSLAGRDDGAAVARGQLQKLLIQADLLILDDLGAERSSDFAEEQIIGVVDQRLNCQKPWMIASHLVREEFIARYDARLVDRILGEGQILHLAEGSVRYKRARQ